MLSAPARCSRALPMQDLLDVTVRVIVEDTDGVADLDNKVPPRWFRVKDTIHHIRSCAP